MTYAPGVTLITATGDRPEAFDLCAQFVARQTYQGPMQWLIVCDCKVPYLEIPANLLASVQMLNPEPPWRPGQNTLARNLLAAIPHVRYDKVLFCEDDENYQPDFVQKMADFLGNHVLLVGDPVSPYYHLPTRQYRMMRNTGMASLAQTGMRAQMLPILAEICRAGADMIDYRLWRATRDSRLLTVGSFVGIKGLPGRPGIGVGHHPERNPELWTPDPDLSVLRSWVGDDANLYERFAK